MELGIITAVVLVCAATLRIPDCTVDTATDVIQGLDANTPIECLMNSQALVSQSALAPLLKHGQYLKVVCAQKEKLADIMTPSAP
jgi:hypothetical protein